MQIPGPLQKLDKTEIKALKKLAKTSEYKVLQKAANLEYERLMVGALNATPTESPHVDAHAAGIRKGRVIALFFFTDLEKQIEALEDIEEKQKPKEDEKD